MTRINKIWSDLSDLDTDVQILGYWEKKQSRILGVVNDSGSDHELVIQVLLKLTNALNNKEQYSSVYYLYKKGYQPIEDRLKSSIELNELKYELGRGLHHNRKYSESKKLFNELASTGFDTSRLSDWWDQSAFASTREKVWLKADIIPSIGSFMLWIAYVLVALKTKEFVIATTVFIVLFELYEAWWYQYKIGSYLSEFKGDSRMEKAKRKIKKGILIEFLLSLLFYPIYFLNEGWLLPLIVIVAIYFQVFHFGLNYYYLPKLVGKLNRGSEKMP